MIIQEQLDYFNSQEDWVYLSKENKQIERKYSVSKYMYI